MDNKEVKIFLWKAPIGRLDKDIVDQLKNIVPNRSKWIRECCLKQFGYKLSREEDILEFETLLSRNHYKNITEWLREKAREEIRNNTPLK